MSKPTRDARLSRVQSSSTSGGPLFVSYRVQSMEGGKVVITLPHDTSRTALARRLRQMADEIEPVSS